MDSSPKLQGILYILSLHRSLNIRKKKSRLYQFTEKFVIMTREGGRCSEFMTFYDKGGREGKNLPFFYDIIFEWPLGR